MRLRIQDWLDTRRIRQPQLAKALGVSRSAVSAWVTGKSYPDFKYLPLLCEFFECKIEELIEIGDIESSSSLSWRNFIHRAA